ncbi:MAG: hypothetical protein ACOY9Y_01530 [Bacillota bacterium]
MHLPGNLYTTAMGIMPHTDAEQALRLALSVDIPFWPQLPKLSFFEDMYAQVSENLPGVRVLADQRVIEFKLERFYQDLPFYHRWLPALTLCFSKRREMLGS